MAYINTIGILIAAKDEASAVIAKSAAETRAATSEVNALGKESSAAGTAMKVGLLAAGLAAIATAGVSIKAAGDYQASVVKLATSAGESVDNLKMVGDGMLKIATETGSTTQSLADAMYKVESGGQHGAEGLLVLKAAAQGAKAEQSDLTVVADAVTSVLVDYHLKAQDAANVTSKLVAATAAGKMSFQDLAGAMPAILPVASAAHVSLNDILGDLASMTVHGMSAQQAAENMTDTIRHMQAPTAMQAKELALLGLTTTQLADDMKNKGLSGVLQEISGRIERLMPPGGDKVILDLKAALNGLSPAVKELGSHVFDGTMSLKEFGKAASALDPISAKQALSFATLAGQMHRIGDQQMTGADAMQNYGQALARATGDATGLKVALMLTGENAGVTNDAIASVSKATADASGNVKGWSEIQETFNNKWDRFKEGIAAGTILLGQQLLPAAGYALDSISKMGDAIAAGTKYLQDHGDQVAIAASVLTVLFGPALVGVAAKATIAGAVSVAAAVKSGVAWVASGAKMSLEWEINALKVIGQGIAMAASAVVQAASVGAAWVASAATTSAVWLRELPKVVLQGSITAAKATISAADTALAWTINAVRVSFVWVTQEMPKLAVSFVTTSAKATVEAAVTSAAWIASAARTSAIWVVTELPKIVVGFVTTSASAVAQALISSGAWVASASTSATAWVITQLPRIIAGFVAIAGSAVAQAAVATAAWVASSVTASASYGAFAALIATPLVMPAIAVGAAIASLALVFNKAQETLNVIDQANASAEKARASGDATDLAMLKRSRDKSLSQADRDAAMQYMQKFHVYGHALGTNFAPGGLTMVGEDGPELVNLPRGSKVHTNRETQQMMSGGGQTVNIGTVQIHNNMDQQKFLKDLGWRLSLA